MAGSLTSPPPVLLSLRYFKPQHMSDPEFLQLVTTEAGRSFLLAPRLALSLDQFGERLSLQIAIVVPPGAYSCATQTQWAE